MLRERFFRPATWRSYPEVGYMAVATNEATLPRHSQQRLAPGTPYIDHTVYLGYTNHADRGQIYRNFYERRAGLRGRRGRKIISSQEYNQALTQEGVPQAPAEGLWQVAAVLYVPAIRALAMVELPKDSTKQSRVTTIGQRRIPRDETHVKLPNGDLREYKKVSLNSYVQELEALGFPEGAFNHVRRRWTRKNDQTSVVSEVLDFPVIIRQLDWLVHQTVFRPLRAVSERVHRHGRFMESIRTENSRPDLRKTA